MLTEPAPRFARWRLMAWLGFITIFAGLGYSAQFADVEEPGDLAYRYSSSVAAVIQYGIILGILLLIARGLPKRDVFALRRPASWPLASGVIVGAYIVILGIGYALSPFLDANEEQGLIPDEWDPSRAGAFAAFFASVTILAPVVEELTFRGLGYTLIVPYGPLIAIATTSLLFGVAHGLVIALPVLTAFGLLLGLVRAMTNSIYPSMILHSTFNALALVSVLVAG